MKRQRCTMETIVAGAPCAVSLGHAGPKGRAADHSVGRSRVVTINGHVRFEGLSVNGADVSHGTEHGLLFSA